MPPVTIHKLLSSPTVTRRSSRSVLTTAFTASGDGTATPRGWHLAETCEYSSYAEALVEAGKQVHWLGRVLAPEADWRLTYHLELLRGHRFKHERFVENRFGDHDHCSACRAKFMEIDWPGVQRHGYVTRFHIPDGSGDWQWNWICDRCFSDLSQELQWQLDCD
jgi:hypothetical protein